MRADPERVNHPPGRQEDREEDELAEERGKSPATVAVIVMTTTATTSDDGRLMPADREAITDRRRPRPRESRSLTA